MYNRLSNQQYWYPFGGRPFIFVPASVLNNNENIETGEAECSNNIKSSCLSSNDESLSSAAAVTSDGKSPCVAACMSYLDEINEMTGNNGAAVFGVPVYTATSEACEKRPATSRHRKTKRIEMENVRKAEDVAEYKGRMPIDDLVNFINCQEKAESHRNKNESKNQKKRSEIKNKTIPQDLDLEHNDTGNARKRFEDKMHEITKTVEMVNIDCMKSDAEKSLHDVATDNEDLQTTSVNLEGFTTVVSRKKKSKMPETQNKLKNVSPEVKKKSNTLKSSSAFYAISEITSSAPFVINPTPTNTKVTSSALPTNIMITTHLPNKTQVPVTTSRNVEGHPSLQTLSQNPCNKNGKLCSISKLTSPEDSEKRKVDEDRGEWQKKFNKDNSKNHRLLTKGKNNNEPVVFINGNYLNCKDIGVSFGYETCDMDFSLNAIDITNSLKSNGSNCIQNASKHENNGNDVSLDIILCKQEEFVEKNSVHKTNFKAVLDPLQTISSETLISTVNTNHPPIKRNSNSKLVLPCLTVNAPILKVSPMPVEKTNNNEEANNDGLDKMISTESVTVQDRACSPIILCSEPAKEQNNFSSTENEEPCSCHQPMAFNLLYAQIFLHKTFTDTLADSQQNDFENLVTLDLTNDEND